MSTVILTLCSANYLAQAKTLGDSLRENNPDCHFVIGLVDRWPRELEAHYCHPYEVLPVEALGLPELPDMMQRYKLVELNTSVKPFYMEHLYRRDPNVQSVIYFDPDILVLAKLQHLKENLQRYSVVLTPHCTRYDEDDPRVGYERDMLGGGIYNLGFLGTSRSEGTLALLRWWKKRLVHYCYYRPHGGLFVDQLWMILVPLFFPNVLIEKHLGYNMCYWNFRERKVSCEDGRYRVNGTHDLIFYHFSSYDALRPELISNREPPIRLSEHSNLATLFADYRARLLANQYEKVAQIGCAFYPADVQGRVPASQVSRFKQASKRLACAFLRFLPPTVRKGIRKLASFVETTCST